MNTFLKYILTLYCGSMLALSDVTQLIEVTDALNSGNDVIVVLVTPWCSICKSKSFLGALEEYKKKYPKTQLLRVDAEKYPAIESFLLKRCKLRKNNLGYPTTLTFKNGKKHDCIVGTTSVAELERALDVTPPVVKRKKKRASTCPVVSTKMIYK